MNRNAVPPLTPAENDMSKILVVTYSLTGTGARLSDRLCAAQGWQSGRIRERVDRTGLSGTLRCVLDSMLRREPAIDYVGPAPDRFDLVVLVSPIWAQRLAGPMRSFLVRHGPHLKAVAVVSVMASRGAPNAVAEIGRITGRSPVLATAFTAREVDDGSCANRLQAFADALRGALDNTDGVRPADWSPRTA